MEHVEIELKLIVEMDGPNVDKVFHEGKSLYGPAELEKIINKLAIAKIEGKG